MPHHKQVQKNSPNHSGLPGDLKGANVWRSLSGFQYTAFLGSIKGRVVKRFIFSLRYLFYLALFPAMVGKT